MAKILVVDDDQGMREFLEIMMTREGYRVVTASDAGKALARCRKETFDLVITDLKMPKMDGIAFLKEVKQLSPETMVILITAYASGGTAVNAMKEGAYDYIEKDFAIEDLKRIVRDALAKKGVNRDDALFLKEGGEAVRFGNMIGSSPEMLKVYATIKKVADTPANVLILGESGTGKELVARSIHENSSRRKMPFLVINCGGISENLLESELFGYIKGAFTGAYTDKGGLFKAARGGTIFLDEIAELPPPLQVKLLRVVQEKTFRRIGGAKDIQVDVRIISATHQNLADNVKTGTFREDLYYRLSVFPVTIPPLRERREDIIDLLQYFLENYRREDQPVIHDFSHSAIELLKGYNWPGNIRELQNISRRLLLTIENEVVKADDLPMEFRPKTELAEHRTSLVTDDRLAPLTEIERDAIMRTLNYTHHQIVAAAKILGIGRSTLYRKMATYGIHLPDSEA